MSNRFLNDNTATGGGVSTADLNTWFATKSSDSLKQGVLNLYITPAEKTILGSLSSATTAPTPNTIAKRDGSGSSSFYNLSAVGMFLRFDNTTEPSINLRDTQASDYALLTDRNQGIPNLYLRNQNQSGHLHLQGRQQINFNTNNGASLQTAVFNSSGLFTAPFINSLSGLNCNTTISGAKITTSKLVVEGQSGDIQSVIGISGSSWFFNSFNNDAMYLTASSAGASNVAIGTATNQPLTFLTNNLARANIDTNGNFNVNFSGNTLVGNSERSNLNIINTNPNNATKTAGMKFWMTDNIGQQKNIGHIYVRTDNANVVSGDLVLANSVVDYEANPSLTCRSDGRVYVNGLTSSGTLVSSSGFITTNISCGFINSLSGMIVLNNISAVKITTPDLVVNSNLLSNGVAIFNGSGLRSDNITSTTIVPPFPAGLGQTSITLGRYSATASNDVYITTGFNGTIDMRAENFLFKGSGNTPSYATFDVDSCRFFRPLITSSGFTTQNISANGTIATQRLTTLSGVGIGTSTTNALLQFANSTGNRKLVLYDDFNNDHQFYGFGINAGSLRYQSHGTHDFYISNGGSASRSIASLNSGGLNLSGSIGIYSTATSQLGGDTLDNLNLSFDTDNINLYANLSGLQRTNFRVGTINTNPMTLMTNNSQRIRITGASGFVGINKTSPSYNLDVEGTTRATNFTLNGNSLNWWFENIGQKTNGSTFTLPSGRFYGEIHLQYGNDSGEVGIKKYAFAKSPGATGNGITTQQIYFYRSATSAESGISFDQNSGVFTFNLSGVNPSATASIWYRSGT